MRLSDLSWSKVFHPSSRTLSPSIRIPPRSKQLKLYSYPMLIPYRSHPPSHPLPLHLPLLPLAILKQQRPKKIMLMTQQTAEEVVPSILVAAKRKRRRTRLTSLCQRRRRKMELRKRVTVVVIRLCRRCCCGRCSFWHNTLMQRESWMSLCDTSTRLLLILLRLSTYIWSRLEYTNTSETWNGHLNSVIEPDKWTSQTASLTVRQLCMP
mmetsp:Transcript_28646/g.46407  ORF Transcript_28646/g.46407 Transcript_28646/m.46407 type:complete len:209 (-) Transcript_28646:1194-1820(-)